MRNGIAKMADILKRDLTTNWTYGFSENKCLKLVAKTRLFDSRKLDWLINEVRNNLNYEFNRFSILLFSDTTTSIRISMKVIILFKPIG